MDLAQTIEQLGYEVLEAGTVKQAAVTLDSRQDISIALIDIGLPDGNGLDLAFSLTTRFPKMRVIIASGYGEPMQPAVTTNPRLKFVTKPYDSKTIHQMLEGLTQET
jgi:DNA-binding NtrC family response regulator